MAPINKKRLWDNDQDLESDSENEHSYNSCNNWPRFLVVESSSDNLQLSKLLPFAILRRVSRRWPEPSKALKGWEMDLSWWSVAKGPRRKTYSEQTDLLTDQSGSQFTRPWTSLGEQSDVGTSLSEPEIRDILKDQGVVGVNRVTLKEGKVIPTNTLFLIFSSPELLKEVTVGYLKVKVALFVPSPMHCFNCNKFGLQSQRCKVAAKCMGCGKDKHEGQYEGPKLCSNCNGPHASSAKDCLVWQKEKEIQSVCVEKCISFPEARQLVQAKMPTVISGGKTYAAAASTRRESKSVQCQTSLTWVFSERPLRMSESNMCSTGGPDRYRPELMLPLGSQGRYRPRPGFSESPLSVLRRRIGVQLIPPKQPLGIPPIPQKWHLRVLRLPPKGSNLNPWHPLQRLPCGH